jgi:predicted N-acetyltransferase YhbS
VLRGMYVHPEHIGKGIGSGLLKAIEPVLAETNSYCIPFDHLFDFYGKAGFSRIEPNDAPAVSVMLLDCAAETSCLIRLHQFSRQLATKK